MDKEELLIKMHEQALIANKLYHELTRIELLELDVDCRLDSLNACIKHLDYLNNALENCDNDYDKKCYELQIYNTKCELKKAEKKLQEAREKFSKALENKAELQRNYDVEEAKYKELQKEYKKLIGYKQK